MIARDSEKIGINLLKPLARIGYDYVELPLAQVMALDDRAFARLVEEVEDSGLPCPAVGNFFPADMRLVGPNANGREELETYLTKAFDRAARLGARVIVFGSGWVRNIPDGYAHQAGWRQLVDALRLADDLIGRRGICIAIEPLNRKESNMILSLAEALTLAKDAARPHIRVHVDFYHLMMECESIEMIGKAAGFLQHAHIANPAGRVWPKAGDGAAYHTFFDALRCAGYGGDVSVEAFSNEFERDADEALTLLRALQVRF